jgi:hypothetical protein
MLMVFINLLHQSRLLALTEMSGRKRTNQSSSTPPLSFLREDGTILPGAVPLSSGFKYCPV